MRPIIESSAQQMSQANDPLAEKKLQLEIESRCGWFTRQTQSPSLYDGLTVRVGWLTL